MHILEVIKYEGDNSTFVWKHPCEDFNTKSQLIVHESQQAVLLVDGQASEPLGAGRYTLDTKNFPILRHIVGIATGGESPFHCEVYFINQTVQMGLKWGTDTKVRYLDPDSGIPIGLGASGEMNLAVKDSRKLLFKLVGTMNGIAWGENGADFTKSLQTSFRPLVTTAVKANLSAAIKQTEASILEVDEHLQEISAALQAKLIAGFEEYGLTVPEFYVTNIVLPEEDANFKRLRELQSITLQTRVVRAEATVRTAQAQAEADVTAARRAAELEKQTTETELLKRQAERDLIKAQTAAQAERMKGFTEADIQKAKGMAEAEVMAAKGYTGKDMLSAEVQKAYAEGIGKFGSGSGGINIGNSAGGGSNMAGDMVSMMAGMKMAGMVMDKMDGMFSFPGVEKKEEKAAEKPENKCPKCGAVLPEAAKFCFSCGEKLTPAGMVVCPSCGKTVPKGAFCLECGHAFEKKCPSCGEALPEGARFCLHCGTKIE